MNKKTKNALLVSLGVTIVFSIGAFLYVQNARKPVETMEIAIAKKEIKAGEVFTNDNYEYVKIPKVDNSSYIQKVAMEDGTYNDVLKGKEATNDIYPNEEIVKGRVSGMAALTDDKGEVIDLSGYRKLTYKVDGENSLSGQVKKGDKLDFWVRYKLNDKKNKDQLVIVDKILKDVIVNKCFDANGLEIVDPSIPATTVELLVTEEELQEYIKFKDLGKYTLVKAPVGGSSSEKDEIVRKKLSTNDLIWEIISMEESEVTADKIKKDPNKKNDIGNFEIGKAD